MTAERPAEGRDTEGRHARGRATARKTRAQKLGAVVVVALFTIFFGAAAVVLGVSAWMVVTAAPQTYSVSAAPVRDVALVLGAQVRTDGPSDMLADRLLAARDLYVLGRVKKLLLSGDAQRNYNEVRTMRRFLIEGGVPDAAIAVDAAGFRTFDSLYRARHVYRLRSFVVVTNGFHVPRALFLARAFGLDAIAVGAQRQGYPSSTRLRNLGREHLARVLALLDVYVLGTVPRVIDPPVDVMAPPNQDAAP